MAVQSNVVQSELGSLVSDFSRKIKGLRGEAILVDPLFPVHGAEDIIDLLSLIVLLNPEFPGFTELNGGN